MSRTHRPGNHNFRIGELLLLAADCGPFACRTVVQVVGFRGDHLRVIPPSGMPMPVHHASVVRTGLAGSSKVKFKRRRKPRPQQQLAAV